MPLNNHTLKNPASRFTRAGVVAAVAAALLSGCASANTADSASQGTHATTHDAAVHVGEAWIKAAPDGMTSGFAQLQNTTGQEKALVSVSSPVAESVELHEMAGTGTSMSMQKLDGPLAIPANSTVALEPGAKHLMLMGLKQELKAGSTATLVFTYADQSTDEVDFEIKEFGGAKESYAPEAEHSGHGDH
ncbi:copper chaperone PCu(A)C [Paeniglutamicibacter kerguelensis]|uniref:Copper(I)-binding protein n=1 Tax=Paeniglutamicibacter kerguelensis TaxID=254788 RepID=A0ABS4XFQ8_9MICC|nr:copper chaperone PCu(A)C [Paeniglutamicibacter kerguelensis]MBP2387228.1 copper(I)-binding protein [Paeniglutamicibacter kerguelensis]